MVGVPSSIVNWEFDSKGFADETEELLAPPKSFWDRLLLLDDALELLGCEIFEKRSLCVGMGKLRFSVSAFDCDALVRLWLFKAPTARSRAAMIIEPTTFLGSGTVAKGVSLHSGGID